jgi:hypothetical protein
LLAEVDANPTRNIFRHGVNGGEHGEITGDEGRGAAIYIVLKGSFDDWPDLWACEGQGWYSFVARD